MKGRGTSEQPPNRFEQLRYTPDPDGDPSEDVLPRTQFFRDPSESIVSRNDSPDLGFQYSLNPYRGCEHGCAYCYARPTHEYLGWSAGLDFESRILVKDQAAKLLRKFLSRPSYKPEVLALSGVTDPYQPAERRFQVTRQCLEVLAECRHPVTLVTKNSLIRRDLDLLRELSQHQACQVFLSITTLDPDLQHRMEPRAASPRDRLETLRLLHEAGIPTGILMAPVIPGLNDQEIVPLFQTSSQAGARFGSVIPLRLPGATAELFQDWLKREYPLKFEKVMSRVREMRGGALNDARFGSRFRGEGWVADQIHQMVRVARVRAGMEAKSPKPSAEHFRRPSGPQLDLF